MTTSRTAGALLVALGVSILVPSADAEPCFNRNILGTGDTFWSLLDANNNSLPIIPRQYLSVVAHTGDVVTLSVEGEKWNLDPLTCREVVAVFEIYRNGIGVPLKQTVLLVRTESPIQVRSASQ